MEANLALNGALPIYNQCFIQNTSGGRRNRITESLKLEKTFRIINSSPLVALRWCSLEKFAPCRWCSMKMCSLLLLLCASAEGTRAEVMLQTPLSSSCWQCPGTPRAAEICSHSPQLQHQGSVAWISPTQDQQEFLKSTSAVRAGCGWAVRGKGAVFSLGWQRAVCLLACSTGISETGEAQLTRQRHGVVMSWF